MRQVCIPESGEFAISVPAQAATAGHAALFDAASAAMPVAAPGASAVAEVQGDALVVRISGLPAAWQGRSLALLPEVGGVLQNAAPPETAWSGGNWQARVLLDPQRSAGPSVMPVVLTTPGQAAGLQIDVAVSSPWPTVAAPTPLPPLGDVPGTPVSGNPAPDSPAPAASPIGLPLALLLALVGGALLNLMPCVFPVLSLKVMGFAVHAGDRRAHLASGLAYTVGVVLSFVTMLSVLSVPLMINPNSPTLITVDVAYRINTHADYAVANALCLLSLLVAAGGAAFYLRHAVKNAERAA
jgi:hypothetical protein